MTFADTLVTDGRYAWRSLTHSRSFAAVTIVTLAAGVGLATAIFSTVNRILLQPLPIHEPDRVVTLTEIPASATRQPSGLGDELIGEWIGSSKTLASIAPFAAEEVNISVGAETHRVNVGRIGGQFFDVVRTRPLEGRLLAPADAAREAAPVALISERAWRRLFGGATDVLSRTITIESAAHTIVGVLPAGFAFPERDLDVWVPGKWRWPAAGSTRNFRMTLKTYARMHAQTDPASVEAEGNRTAINVAMANPAFADGLVVPSSIKVERLQDVIVGPVRPALMVLAAGMACVLLAACINLACLLLARNTARARDLAVRVALGAGRARLVRPVLLEQMMLAAAGGALGAVVAWWALGAIAVLAPPDLPRLSEIRFDGVTLAFACLTALLTALLVTVVPTWQLPSHAVRALATSGRASGSADRTRSVLVALQVALASVLLVSALLVGRSLIKLLHVDPGYRAEGVLTFQVPAPDSVLRERGRQARFFETLLTRLRAHPSVLAAGTSGALPLHNIFIRRSFQIEGVAPPVGTARPMVTVEAVGPGYVEAAGIRLVEGRLFTDDDRSTAPVVAVANVAFARDWLNGQSAVGTRLVRFNKETTTIVGVVDDVRRGSLSERAEPTIYLPLAQTFETMAYGGTGAGVAVRTTGDPMDIVPFVREQVRALEPSWPLHNVMRLEDRLDATFVEPRFYTIVLALFALMTVSTAVLGLYGVLSYAVERRRLEIGVRRALGATERDVVGLVLRRAVVLALAGLTLGLLVVATGGQVIRALLFGIEPLDLPSMVLVVVLVAAVVLLSAWHPTKLALRIDPADALKSGDR